MTDDRETFLNWRARVSGLRAPACGMAHESVRSGADARSLRSAQGPGYARPGICPAAVREGHLGCSHTMARHVLSDALAGLPDAPSALLCELEELENAISLLDHRRYDAETRLARAIDDERPAKAAQPVMPSANWSPSIAVTRRAGSPCATIFWRGSMPRLRQPAQPGTSIRCRLRTRVAG